MKDKIKYINWISEQAFIITKLKGQVINRYVASEISFWGIEDGIYKFNKGIYLVKTLCYKV